MFKMFMLVLSSCYSDMLTCCNCEAHQLHTWQNITLTVKDKGTEEDETEGGIDTQGAKQMRIHENRYRNRDFNVSLRWFLVKCVSKAVCS